MPIRGNTGRRSAPAMSSSGFLGRSSVALTKWLRLFARKGVVSCCFMRSFAVCTSTNSRCPLYQPSNQTPKFYIALDILPVENPLLGGGMRFCNTFFEIFLELFCFFY